MAQNTIYRQLKKKCFKGLRVWRELAQISRAKATIDEALYTLDIPKLSFIKRIKHGEIRVVTLAAKNRLQVFWKDSKRQIRSLLVEASWLENHYAYKVFQAE
jgi:hypothetical protein